MPVKRIKLMLTPKNIEKIKQVSFNDIPEVYDHQLTRDGIGSIAKLAFPFDKNFLHKV